MREIKSGDIIMRIRSTAMTPLFYKQEFKRDIMVDWKNLDENNPDVLVMLQLVWVMNKTQMVAEKNKISGFEQWLEENQDIVFEDIMKDSIEELADGFFRTKAEESKLKPKRK